MSRYKKLFSIQLDARSGVGASADLIDSEGGLMLTRIFVPLLFRRQGFGNKLLKKMLSYADQEALNLYLCASSYGAMTDTELVAWYERNGFVVRSDGVHVRVPKRKMILVKKPCPCGCAKFLVPPLIDSVDCALYSAEADELINRWNSYDTSRHALTMALRLFDEALPKFNWAASALDANAITLLTTVPHLVCTALNPTARVTAKTEDIKPAKKRRSKK